MSDTIQSFNHLTASCKHTLLRLLQSELSSLTAYPTNLLTIPLPLPLFPHSQFRVSASRFLCHPYFETGDKPAKGIHVNIVCTLNGKLVQFIVSDRNPKYISWGTEERASGHGLYKSLAWPNLPRRRDLRHSFFSSQMDLKKEFFKVLEMNLVH
ncbi:LOW QUALITY PROTEIN: hypothetical protein RJ639_008747 [Escallonia herrerae]|uniref:Uncharacterized protein n=1 Tax=Escallonia herrerae TaxID=1293975 RepID=A0AA88VT27_9ASTE|nr:LOW QUALITY PROTEIN: hypothetical protein RJ639_008747 [Escallonia herrerae]